MSEIPVEHYVMLRDWTERELRADKRGAIPEHLARAWHGWDSIDRTMGVWINEGPNSAPWPIASPGEMLDVWISWIPSAR